MNSKLFRLLALFVVLAMVLAPLSTKPAMAVAGPTTDEAATEGSPSAPIPTKGVVGGVSETGLYIVQLKDASLAAYQGGLPSLAATSPEVTGARKLDVKTPESQAYLSYLEAQQSDFIAQVETTLGRSVEVQFQYRNVLNALAVQINFEEAVNLSKLDGVKAVFADKVYQLDTDVGPDWIGAPAIWEGDTGSGVDTQGEGVIIGVIDTGINHAHPSFADVGGDLFDHTNPYSPGVYVGWCETNPSFCNDKLIGAYGLNPVGGSPEDTNGHGSHTSSTAGGNRHDAIFIEGTTTFTRTISGVAPHANIIAYQVCDPDGCPGSATVMAVDHAISDEVDVLNYSISGGDDPWNDPVDLAFLDAFADNIYVSASAGNTGPGASTVAKTGPWNAAVGASTHSRIFANPFDITGPGAVPPDLVNLAALQGTGPVLSTDISASISYDPTNLTGCTAFPTNYFRDKLALIQRGGCTFLDKVTNAYNAGAVGVIMVNNAGGPPIVMGGLTPPATTIPSAMLGLDDGLAVKAWIDDYPTATATLYAAVNAVENPDFADILADFSSRGPSQFDILKPDFIAPGVNVLAAVAASGGDPVQYGLYGGTSMSSPHGAGSGALMVALHPDWSPVEIKSALASSAYNGTDILKENAVTPADPHDMGSGRLWLADAATVGLVWDETYDNFVAADPDLGGEPKTLNLSTMTSHTCVNDCSWTRTVKSVLSTEANYTATFTSTVGIVGTVTPDVFTIPAGGTQVLTITADVSALTPDVWVFGYVMLETDEVWGSGMPVADQHMTLSVLPKVSNVPDLVTIETDKKSGSQVVSDLQVAEGITDLTIEVDGLTQAMLYKPEVAEDGTPSNPYDGNGTFFTTIEVDEDAMRLVAQVMESPSLDVDLFVGTGDTPSAGTVVCTSATAAVLEYCNLDNPVAGTYWVLVQNWTGSGAPTDLIATAVGTVQPGDAGNLTVTGPAVVPPGGLFDLSVNWDIPDLVDEDVYYGVFSVGTDAANPGNLGSVAVNFSYTQPIFLTKLGPDTAQTGDVVEYSLVMEGAGSINGDGWLTDTLPVGVEFAGELTATFGTASYDATDNAIYWTNGLLVEAAAGGSVGESRSRSVSLNLDASPVDDSPTAPAPAAPQDAVSLVIDDGTIENNIGIGGTWEFIFLNRFTPAAEEFPFDLNQVQIYFDSSGLAQVGDQLILAVYENTSGNTDPAVGSNLLATFPATVQAVNAWNVYDLATPVSFTGPGDVLIGVIALEVPGTSYWPAAMDQTATQQRSWAGWWLTYPPPSPPVLPPDDIWILIDTYFPGNWMIRGYGETTSYVPDVITVTFNVTVTMDIGEVTNVANLTYDGDSFEAESLLEVVAPPEVTFVSNTPVTLGEMAIFTPTVTGTTPFEYLWDFGDTITSTLESPTHLYAATGTYTVTLTVTNDWGTDVYTAEFVVVQPVYYVYLPLVWRAP